MVYLVIGGTGMLQGTVRGLLADGHDVYLVSRHRSRFLSLASTAGSVRQRLRWVSGDYTHATSFRTALSAICAKAVPDAVIAWMPDGPSWPILLDVMRAHHGTSSWTLFRVRGSQASRDEPPTPPPGVLLHLVILGFVVTASGSRWLSPAEIAMGTLDAVRRRERRHIVGAVEPWDQRPPW